MSRIFYAMVKFSAGGLNIAGIRGFIG